MEGEFVSLSATGTERVIVVFLGWGMDGSMARGLNRQGYDILVVWDYATRGRIPDLSRYAEIGVVAWSFGVAEAGRWIAANPRLPITRRVAINGTLFPVDADKGIPPKIFNITLAWLSEQAVGKFLRRMFVSEEEFRRFPTPCRSFKSRRRELEFFAHRPDVGEVHFDKAIIGEADRIFPPANQKNAWQGTQMDLRRNSGHYIDLQTVLSEEFVDKERVAERFAKSRGTYNAHSTTQQLVAGRLWDMLALAMHTPPSRVLEIGAGTGALTRLYASAYPDAEIDLWDIAEIATDELPSNCRFVRCDAEKALRSLPDNSYDLVMSASTLQWFNSPAGALAQIRRVLRPGGCMGITMFVKGTYHELTDITGTGLPYPEAQTMAEQLDRLFPCAIFADNTDYTDFDSPQALLAHIRFTGVNGLAASPASAALRLRRHLPARPRLTYHSVMMIGHT